MRQMKSRRDVLVSIASAPAVAQQASHPHPGHDPESAGMRGQAKLLKSGEMEALAVLVDLIIPPSDTPGARDAGAHWIIDSVMHGSAKASQDRFRRGLAPFVKLNDAARLSRLRSLHQNKDPFFRLLKDLTVDAYYSTREGLQSELGWSGYTPLAEFKGCTHPEHRG